MIFSGGFRRFIFPLTLLLVVAFSFIMFVLPRAPASHAMIDVSAVYSQGEKLDGTARFIVKEGELIPRDTRVLITYGTQSRSFALADFIHEKTVHGRFYVEGTSLQGEGEGFGVSGVRHTNPALHFNLQVFGGSEAMSGGSSGSSSNRNVNASGSSLSPHQVSPANAATATTKASQSSSGAGATGAGAGSSSGGSSPQVSASSESSSPVAGFTGGAITEYAYVVDGAVDRDHPFHYTLSPGQRAKIVEGTITLDGTALPSSSLSFEIKDNVVTVTTDYSTNERGFGSPFLGEGLSVFPVDLSEFDLYSMQDQLVIQLVYNNLVLSSYQRDITLDDLESSLPALADADVQFIAPLPTLHVTPGRTFTLDLSSYVRGGESYELTLSNITTSFEGSVLYLVPDAGFKGARRGTLHVFSTSGEFESNEFLVVVSTGTVNVRTVRDKITVGEPVHWMRHVTLESPEDLRVELPHEAQDVRVTSVDDSIKSPAGSTLTGNAVIEVEFRRKPALSRWWQRAVRRITGNALSDNGPIITNETKDVVLSNGATSYVIDYYTPAPIATEEETPSGKFVTVSAPDGLGYTDVIASTTLTSLAHPVRDSSEIRVVWRTAEDTFVPKKVRDVPEHFVVEEDTLQPSEVPTESSSMDVPFDAYDSNDDGIIDYIEWVVPHLSNQLYQIILITKADHLDPGRLYVSDIYPDVRALDGNWSETIPNGHYVRVTFERNLTAANDITLYPRIISGTPHIDVYTVNGTTRIGQFTSLINNVSNRILLTGLNHSEAVFDLQVLEGSVQFDYIVDPLNGTVGLAQIISTCGNLTTSGITYVLNQSINATLSGPCFIVNASNVSFNLRGYTISSDSNGNDIGVSISGANVLVLNGSLLDFGAKGVLVNSESANVTLSTLVIRAAATGNFGGGACGPLGVSLSGASSVVQESIVNLSLNNPTNCGTTVDSYGVIVSSSCTGCAVSSTTVQHFMSGSSAGIYVASPGTTLSSNLYFNNSRGLSLMGASGSTSTNDYFQDLNNYGIEMDDSSNNSISNALINGSTLAGISLVASSLNKLDNNNTFTNVTVLASASSGNDLLVTAGKANFTTFTNSYVSTYALGADGGIIALKRTSFADIVFLRDVNGSGTNLTDELLLQSSRVVINATQTGLNKTANITFYNVPTAFASPTLYRDDVVCGTACYNYTSLNAGTVIFNVSFNGNYSIGESDSILFVNITFPLNTTYAAAVTSLNYTAADLSGNLQTCSYSTDNGVTNTTVTCGSNVTGLSSSEGSSTWRFYARDSSGNLNMTSVTFSVDTLPPTNLLFASPSDSNGSYVSRRFILVNISASDTSLANLTLFVLNASGAIINTSSSNSNAASYYQNVSVSSDGVYYVNFSARDSHGNVNVSGLNTITIDTQRPLIAFGIGTENTLDVATNQSIYVNLSLVEPNVANITFSLYNSSGLVNRTVFASSVTSINWTGLPALSYTYEVNTTDLLNNVNATSLRVITLMDSCLMNCTEGSSCTFVNSNCYLYSGMCTSGICDFVNMTLRNSTIYTLYNASGDGNSLVLNLSSNSSTATRFLSASQFVFWGKNGTSALGGSRGGYGGTINLTTRGLFNRTGIRFIGVGGYTTSNSGSGGNGGIVQLNYHGLIRGFNQTNVGPGGSFSASAGTNGSIIMNKDLNCPRDGDLTDNGLVDISDVIRIRNTYNNLSSDSTFSQSYDLNCNNIINVIDLGRLGTAFGNR